MFNFASTPKEVIYSLICVSSDLYIKLLMYLKFIYLFPLPCFLTPDQSESLVVCEVDEDLVKKLKEFRFRKETNNAAIISKSQTLSSVSPEFLI